MKKDLRGMNTKYIKWNAVLGIAAVLSFFLPFIKIQGSTLSGFRYVVTAMKARSVSIQLLLIMIPAVLCLITSVILWIRPNKTLARINTALFTVQAFSCVVTLFTITKYIDKIQIFSEKFLIKYLGAGFYIWFILSFIGMLISMRVIKMSSGYVVLTIMSVIWLFPIAWVVMISFRADTGSFTSYFIPKQFTWNNYYKLLTDTSQFQFVRWFFNTLLVAVCSCIASTCIVLSTAFTLSRIRFEGRKLFMNLVLIAGMFPGFMSMIAVYYILKGLGVSQSLAALVLVYSGGAAMSYYIAKGFFDTIPKSIDEAAYIDGATKWTVFTKLTIPLSKPIVIYTILTSFMSPWADYIFANIIMGDDYKNYTVALGLYTMLNRNNIDTWYTRFAAGAVLVSIPIAFLFISLQKYYVEGLSGSVKG